MCIKTILKGALLGGVIAWVVGFVSWTVLPWHKIHSFTHEQEVVQVLQRNASETGLYVLPSYEQSSAFATSGPLVFASVNYERNGEMGKKALLLSLLTQVIAAAVITALLLCTKGLSFLQRAIFVAAIGFTIAWTTSISLWNWMGFPGTNTVVDLVHYTVCWFLAGLGISAIVGRVKKT
jgi:hypothetical protein